VPYAAHGYGSFFVLSTLDRHYQRDLSVEEALELVRKCVHELQTRFLVNQPRFCVKIVDKDGVREVAL
jgi:20S proteasome subunit beta 4